MTHPLTPREKVAQIIKEKVSGPHFTDPSFFVAMEQDRFAAADAILTALASGSGDHAELARLAEAATPGPWHSAGGYLTVRDPDGSFSGTIYHLEEMGQRGPDLPFQAVPFARSADAAFIAAANPATILVLLAENAALGSELVELREHRVTADLLVSTIKADKAEVERKLAEAVGLNHLTDDQIFAAINAAVTITRDRNGVDNGAVCISPEKFRTFLSKESER